MATRWGLRWSLDLDDNLQRRLFFAHSYEAATLFQVARRMRPDDVILDVGANVAHSFCHCCVTSLFGGKKGIAVEPAPDTAIRLEENLQERYGRSSHHSSGGLVGQRRRRDSLLGRPPDMTTLSSTGRRRRPAGHRRGPPRRRAASGAWARACRRCQIDVEGGEHAVLQGLGGLLRQVPPRLLVVELVERRAPGAIGGVRATWSRC